MTPERWRRVRTIFEDALTYAQPSRADYLDVACAGDEALRRAVEQLLAADAGADSFLQNRSHIFLPGPNGAPTETSPAASWVGQRVGAYRLTELLGRGGMGAVYAAERADRHYQQRVAVKLIRWDADTREMRRRFHVERQILADLQHPNIARLLDGGVTQEGVPYLVMEHVDGQPLTDYCEAHAPSVEQRLELFRTVCEAVQYAHQNLIVHRDLKSSNILVDRAGTVKLLDFGIAKLLVTRSDERSANGRSVPQTRTGIQVFTPECAAPEQIRGEAITTATDVYQLGILLYELLVGRRPYRVRGRSPSAVERVICTEPPVWPSRATERIGRGEQRETEGRDEEGLRIPAARLQGDLDNIVLKALRKEPERRYRSAEQFADDVQRHLSGHPVRARAATLGYRFRTFVRRNRAWVSAAVLILLSLVGGIAVATWQARIATQQRHVAQQQRQRAEQRLTDVRQLAGSFLFEFHDAIADLPGSTSARELVVQRAQEYLGRLAQQPGPDPSLWLDLAVAYRKVGDVQGNPTNANLGRPQDALASYRTGLNWAEKAFQDPVTHSAARRVQAHLYEKLGDVQATTGDLAAAEASKRRAASIYRVRANSDTGAEARREYAVALIKLGDLLGNPNFQNRGEHAAALRQYRAAESILEQLYAADSTANETMRLYGLIYERLGTIHDEESRTEEAMDAYRRSLSIRSEYVDAHPTNTDALRDWAVAHEKMGHMFAQMGALERARGQYRESRAIFQRLFEADRENAQAQQSLAISHMHLGNVAYHPSQPSFDEPAVARHHFETAHQYLEAVHRVDSTRTDTRALLQRTVERLGQLP